MFKIVSSMSEFNLKKIIEITWQQTHLKDKHKLFIIRSIILVSEQKNNNNRQASFSENFSNIERNLQTRKYMYNRFLQNFYLSGTSIPAICDIAMYRLVLNPNQKKVVQAYVKNMYEKFENACIGVLDTYLKRLLTCNVLYAEGDLLAFEDVEFNSILPLF